MKFAPLAPDGRPEDVIEANRAAITSLRDHVARHPHLQRYVVTGSRAWTDQLLLAAAVATVPPAIQMNGMAGHGGDWYCREVAYVLNLPVEPYAAAWRTHGKVAGFVRNVVMMEHMPALCLAFLHHQVESRGTRHAIGEARERRIPTFVFHQR